MPHRREYAVDPTYIETHVPELIEHNPLNDIVRDCIEALDEEERDVILAVFYERLTLEELAQRIGLSGRPGAHYRLQRVLETVKIRLLEAGIYGEEEE